MNTREYIEAIRERHSGDGRPATNYRIAKLLGISTQRFAYYLNGTPFGDDLALGVGKLLDVNPLQVLADINAERAKTARERKAWEKWSRRAAGIAPTIGAAMLTASLVGATLPASSNASQVTDSFNKIYIMRNRKYRRLATIKALLEELHALYREFGSPPMLVAHRSPGDRRRAPEIPQPGRRRFYDAEPEKIFDSAA